MLALAPPSTTAPSINQRRAAPILPVAIGRTASSPPGSLPEEAFNAHRQQTANAEIPIAPDVRPHQTSRGFLPWRFAYAGPRCPPRHLHGAAIRKPSQERTYRRPAPLSSSRSCLAEIRSAAPKPSVKRPKTGLSKRWRRHRDLDYASGERGSWPCATPRTMPLAGALHRAPAGRGSPLFRQLRPRPARLIALMAPFRPQ